MADISITPTSLAHDSCPSCVELRARIAELQLDLDHLHGALASRATIEQAKGVMMAATGVDADAAFAMLVSQSQHENRKLRDVATELVARQRRVAAS